jgi:flagellar P-ring protein precursor FlgI
MLGSQNLTTMIVAAALLLGTPVTALLAEPTVSTAPLPPHIARLKDLSTVEGIRDNQLIGYGLVVGLAGTGDKQQTIFSVQTLANMLQRMGVNIKGQISTIQVRNIAAVFVTATLSAFSRPGVKIDVTVSSIGDAKSLAGGTLLLTPMAAPDGKIYAVAQGSLIIGGYSAGSSANAKIVNHTTVGRIPDGALVERDSSLNLAQITALSILLNDPDFDAASELAAVINRELGGNLARVVDSRRASAISPFAPDPPPRSSSMSGPEPSSWAAIPPSVPAPSFTVIYPSRSLPNCWFPSPPRSPAPAKPKSCRRPRFKPRKPLCR